MTPTRARGRARRTTGVVLVAAALTTLATGCVSVDDVTDASHTVSHTVSTRLPGHADPRPTGTDPADPADPRSGAADPAAPGDPAAAEPLAPHASSLRPSAQVLVPTPAPVRLLAPTVGVNAPVVDLGIRDDGSIEVPSRGNETGWVDTTSLPGAQGPAVLAGHVDTTTGPAVFERLSTVQVGDPINVLRTDGTKARFTVDAVETVAQSRFPTDEVYGPVPVPALRLITCGGAYDRARGGYQSNVVVFAS